MAVEVRTFSITVPAGTPIATPQVTQMSMPVRIVEEIEVQVPPGPRGEVGFRVGSSGVQLIPLQLGQWLVTDDEVIHWPLEDQHESGSWEFTAYNTGLFTHSITVRFLVHPPQVKGAAGSVPIAASDLNTPPSQIPSLPPPPPLPPPPSLPPPTLPPPPVLPPPPGPPGSKPPPGRWASAQEKFMIIFEFNGQLHVMQVDQQGNLNHSFFYGQWGAEVLMSGLQPRGRVAYDIGFNGQLHVFAETPDGRFKHRYFGNGVWSDPEVV